MALGLTATLMQACGGDGGSDANGGGQGGSSGAAGGTTGGMNPGGTMGTGTAGQAGGAGAQGPAAGAGGVAGQPSSTQEVPTERSALEAFLAAATYRQWSGESGVHASTGPHFGGVRTYINDALEGSLAAGNTSHPPGAAAIKELYGDGEEVLGHAVLVKTEEDSDRGAGIYWYELYEGSRFADGFGVGACTGCHSGGSDYVLTPYPLQ